jgi:hypothetical protein
MSCQAYHPVVFRLFCKALLHLIPQWFLASDLGRFWDYRNRYRVSEGGKMGI